MPRPTKHSALLEAGDTDAAIERLQQALAQQPANDDIRFELVKLLLSAGDIEAAHEALAPTLSRQPKPPLRFTALQVWLDALVYVADTAQGSVTLEALDEKIAANKRDFDARYAKARILMVQGDWTAALDELLEIVLRDKQWNDEAARKTFVAILELLTPPAPKPGEAAPGQAKGAIALSGKNAAPEDPQRALVSTYRRRLSMMLN